MKTNAKVVSYRNSTSNHNLPPPMPFSSYRLYLIEILHQTTTYRDAWEAQNRCILSKFYIKPQLIRAASAVSVVVSYRNSTSNHNLSGIISLYRGVVSYRNSTSNHNPTKTTTQTSRVVSYRNSTSNHNSCLCISEETALYLIEILHQTTTGSLSKELAPSLYLIEILHQTTTSGLILIDKVLLTGCLPL